MAPAVDFAALRERVRGAGLLERQPRYYAAKFSVTLALLLGAAALVTVVSGPAGIALAAVALGVAFSQVGLLAHDAAHHQVFATPRANRRLAFVLFDLVVGLSVSWWLEKHNRHHAHPNRQGHDPDIAPVLLVFAPAEAELLAGWRRAVVRHQAWLFAPLLLLEGFHLRARSWQIVGGKLPARGWAEAAAMAMHLLVYGTGLVWALGPLGAAGFAIVHHMTMGAYLGLAFAPNHIGMPLLREEDADGLDYLQQQITTARNVRPGPGADFFFGGLNYQIEHHLFPTMPRNCLREARALVRALCAERGISYRETGVLGGYREVLAGLHAVGRGLRSP